MPKLQRSKPPVYSPFRAMPLALLMPRVKTEPKMVADMTGGGEEENSKKCPFCEETNCKVTLEEKFFEALGICNHRLRHYLFYHYHPYLQRRGSPRTSQGSFTGSPDPHLMSPHAMSPNSAMRQQAPQVSPPFSQGTMTSTGYSQSGPPSYSVTQGPPSATVSSQPSFQEFPDFDVFSSSMQDGKKMQGGDGAMGGGGPNAVQQYVKQELRNMCSARSEKNMQTQQMQQQHLHQKQQQSQQQQQQPSTSQSMSSASLDYESSSELPPEILATINDMSKEHGGPLPPQEEVKEEEVVAMTRKEAESRYQQFQMLASNESNPEVPAPPPEEEEGGVKATMLFRNQLRAPLQHTSSSASSTLPSSQPHTVNVVQKEPRTQVEVKPSEPRNSLLQQLLADV